MLTFKQKQQVKAENIFHFFVCSEFYWVLLNSRKTDLWKRNSNIDILK